jgi:DNA-binding CsgD family transcriptional regulator
MDLTMATLCAASEPVSFNDHVERLVALVSALLPHDGVTVVRYSSVFQPEFLSLGCYPHDAVERYLSTFYVFDPFYAHWYAVRKPGIVTLKPWRNRRPPFVSELLINEPINDEVGILLDDGPEWCLGIFLDRKRGLFSQRDIRMLESCFGLFDALHALDLHHSSSGFRRTLQPALPARKPIILGADGIPLSLWPELSARERELVQHILAGHQNAIIAQKMDISQRAVKNHRRRVYEKLNISNERDLFKAHIAFLTHQQHSKTV